ncbi:MAG: epoxyqueuosine reductase QueH [Victivallales bacterium]|nr:epoxyqueuosine reductase QueH [Victivallales bacterium]
MTSPARPLLLHCCCGPCSTACVERLLAEGRACRLYFSNSNLDSEGEFNLRLENLRKVAVHYGLGEVQIDAYDHRGWLSQVSQVPGYAQCREGGARCAKCFAWSLSRAAQAAAAQGMNFATSLTVSPHKNSRMLLSIGAEHSHFEPYDFKKSDGFLRSLRLSRQLGLYRQSYCGCEFSRTASIERRT